MALDKNKTRIPLPAVKYDEFDNSRLTDMGIAEDEVNDLVMHLIKQIDEYIPKIETAIKEKNYSEIETLNHRIRGSASTVGKGGIADVLNDFNLYVKEEYDTVIIADYIRHIKKCHIKLKMKFSSK